MILRRVAANLIDLLVLMLGTAAGVWGAAQLSEMFGEVSNFLAIVILISQICIIILIPILTQWLFWMDSTTIGKMLVFTETRRTDGEKLDVATMFAREYLSKVLTCYIG